MIPLSVIDAFTDVAFAGNPAAVCLLDRWPSDAWLQLVGREMNLSETAFLVPRRVSEFELRWFTPKVEVALCGHATLASAHFLWASGTPTDRPLAFHTRKSGVLAAARLPTGEIELDFPAKPATLADRPGDARSTRREAPSPWRRTSSITSWSWRRSGGAEAQPRLRAGSPQPSVAASSLPRSRRIRASTSCRGSSRRWPASTRIR